MEFLLILILLIIIWLFWSRQSTNKEIKNILVDVKQDFPIYSNIAIREVLGYCQRNNIECMKVRHYLIINYENKSITVQQEGSDRVGSTIFFIEEESSK